jgi:hypothetical protein
LSLLLVLFIALAYRNRRRATRSGIQLVTIPQSVPGEVATS